jgi:diacylglycerol kinase family enzyme
MWAGIGLDAFVVHRIEPRKQWEKNFTLVRYASSVVWSAAKWRGIELRVVTADQQVHGQYMLAEISNIRLYAGGLATLSPDAVLDDGLMELWLFDGTSWEDVLKQAWSLWSGRHLNSDKVRCLVFDKVILESESNLFIQMDGEPEEAGEQVTIEVLPQALKVMIPDQAPESLFRRNTLGKQVQ